VTPALPEGDITRERLALEEAIRKVEAEAARQFAQAAKAREQTREPDRWEEPPRPAQRPLPAALRPDRPDSRPDNRSETRAEMPARRSPVTAPAMPRPSDSVFDQPIERAPEPPPPPPPAPQPRHPLRRPIGERRTTTDAGVDEFRSVVSEANELGGASARANQSARDAYASVPSPAIDFDRREPRMFDQRDTRGAPALPSDFEQPMLEPSFSDDARPVPPRMRQQRQPARDDFEDEEPGLAPRRSYRDLIKGAGIVAAVACLGGILLWQWPNMIGFYQKMRGPSQTAQVRDAPAPNTTRTSKITDRVESSAAPTTETTPGASGAAGAAVAQKVVLYEEDPNDPNGKRFVGSAIWRTETISPGPGQPPELAVRADIDVPERKLAMTVSLRRNTDKTLPASHTVEIMFKTPADFPSGGISNVPGILMKQAEQTRGVPLAGLAVKVTNGFFLIGLSSADADRDRNLQLLKERAWFDIPVVYANNRRAILAVEKGTPGDRAFAEAFKVWRQ
jgi:hypothetical protein